jgi:hypothetical protein
MTAFFEAAEKSVATSTLSSFSWILEWDARI